MNNDPESPVECRWVRLRLGWAAAVVSVLPALVVAASPERASAAADGADGNRADSRTVEELVVVADRALSPLIGDTSSVTVLTSDTIETIGATHVNEVMSAVPGVWVSRGSGHEHLTAIRSPVLTGAGACGEFLFLENGLPIRPAGFCNVNGLFEANSEQASLIEVWRGPGSAVLGGNAVHGAVNVVHAPRGNHVSLEAGPYDFGRAKLAVERRGERTQAWLQAHGTHSNGYRDATGYGQQKLHGGLSTEVGGWRVTQTVAATLLNQETGAFVRGFEVYEDDDLRRSNPNPEAYRDAWSVRLATHLENGVWRVTPYLRRSRMTFLQHFLPGQPTETNAQTSGGVLASRQYDFDRHDLSVGAHVEYGNGSLRQRQVGPTVGSAFLVETRPPGLHYDYDVSMAMAAAFVQGRVDLTDLWRLSYDARVESLWYDYDNRHIAGNTRDDGSACGFGGCLYTRPADRDDRFTEVAGRLGIERAMSVGGVDGLAYGAISTGFRPPQATELYRLQNGQTVADLDAERLVSLEAGVRLAGVDMAAFAERTRHFIFRDAEGFNVSDGKTKSYGIELGLDRRFGRHGFALAATYAVHRYDFDRAAAAREVITKNNMVDTAPRWLGSARWHADLGAGVESELEYVFVGPHYTNAANTAKYDGHGIVNLRLSWRASRRLDVFARVVNLLDEEYADRADFAFGNHRYFPGMPAQIYAGVKFAFND